MAKSSLLLKQISLSTLALLGLLLPCAASAAPVTVNSLVSGTGPLFSYNFTIIDTGLPNLLSVTLTTPAQATAVQNLTAPKGYAAFFDGGLGALDFVADTVGYFPIGSAVSGFRFQSSFQLGSAAFSALSLDANQNPVTTTGTASPVPEPGTFALLGASLLSFFAICRRTRSTQSI